MSINLKNTCEVCGKTNSEYVVCASKFGPMSFCYCSDCFKEGKEPYDAIVAYIACAGHFPEDINEEYQKEVRRQLVLHNKTEEEFIKDVDKFIEKLMEDVVWK
jgi:hypothetical protein